MFRLLKRIVVVVGLLAVLLIAGGPWLLYFVGLGDVTPLPNPPELIEITSRHSDEAYAVWHQFREHGIIRLTPLSPYTIYVDLLIGPDDYAPGGGNIAGFLAKTWISKHSHYHRGFRWKLSTVALATWLTRHWTVEQLLEAAQEINVIRNCGHAAKV